jgi:hypothetical protein
VPDYDEKDGSMFGSQAFQVAMSTELTAHPSKGMPVKIKMRNKAYMR